MLQVFERAEAAEAGKEKLRSELKSRDTAIDILKMKIEAL